jgi:hypothetical protein
MNPSPSNRTPSSDGPVNPGHPRPALRPHMRRRATLVVATGLVFTVLGVARALSAGPDDPRSDDLVWWGAGVLLLLGPSASLLAVVLVARGIRSDLDLRLRDLSGPWPATAQDAGPQRRDRPGVLGPAIDISEATRTLVGTRPGHPVRADRWTPPGPPFDPTRRARLDVMIVIDVSSSMARTDPTAHRFWAARHLVGLLTAAPGLRGPNAEARLIVGAPRLTIAYRGTTPDGVRPTRVFAQLVDDRTGTVLGNQITPIPVTLDGQPHETTADLEIIAFTPGPASHLTLQLVATTVTYAEPRLGGSVQFDRILLELPVTPSR